MWNTTTVLFIVVPLPYVIYGRSGIQPTLSKVFDKLQWLRLLEIEECPQDLLQIPSAL